MKRYEVFITSGGLHVAMKETGDGDWVKYTDFAAEVNRIVRKRIAERGTVHPAITRAVERGVEDETETAQWELLDRVNERITELNRQYDNSEHVTRGDVRKIIETLSDDIEGYNQPAYDGNPHVTAVRTSLGSVIFALKQVIR